MSRRIREQKFRIKLRDVAVLQQLRCMNPRLFVPVAMVGICAGNGARGACAGWPFDRRSDASRMRAHQPIALFFAMH
jgi:hypothetical protein